MNKKLYVFCLLFSVFSLHRLSAQYVINASDYNSLTQIRDSILINNGLGTIKLDNSLLAPTFAAMLPPKDVWGGPTSLLPPNWYGVEFDLSVMSNVRVKRVDLSRLGQDIALLGYFIEPGRGLPTELFSGTRFSVLEEINLSNCKLDHGGHLPWYKVSPHPNPTLNTQLKRIVLDSNKFDLNVLNVPILTNIASGFPALKIFSAAQFRSPALLPANISEWMDASATISADTVRLSDNKFQGAFPGMTTDLFAFLPNLKNLNISENLFTGLNTSATPLGGNSTLRSANIGNNAFLNSTDISSLLLKCPLLTIVRAPLAMAPPIVGTNYTFPLDLAYPTVNLEYLDVSFNNLQGALDMDYFRLATTSQQLIFKQNSFDTLLFSDQHNHIWYLDISHNEFHQPLPISLLYSENIQYIIANNNRFRDRFPVVPVGSVYPLTQLKTLNLRSNELEGEIPLAWLFQNGSFVYTQRVDLGNNKFSGVQMPATLLTFQNLEQVKVDSNKLDFYDLERLVSGFNITTTFDILDNKWKYYPPSSGPLVGLGIIQDFEAFLYAPQKPLGIGGVRHRAPGEEIVLHVPALQPTGMLQSTQNVSATDLFWVRMDTFPTFGPGAVYNSVQGVAWGALSPVGVLGFSPNIPSILNLPTIGGNGGANVLGTANVNSVPFGGTPNYTLVADSVFQNVQFEQPVSALYVPEGDVTYGTYNDKWYYVAAMTNAAFPNLTLLTAPKRVVVGACYDTLGQQIQCQHMFVQYPGSYSLRKGGASSMNEEERQAVRDSVGVILIKSCPCGDLEMWEISDTTYETYLLANGKGTRNVATASTASPQLLNANSNYQLQTVAVAKAIPSSMPQGNANPNAVRLAFIDSGVDYDHPALTDYILAPQGAASGECELNEFGYNFIDTTDLPYDDHGHGTAVAGVLAGAASSTQGLKIDTDNDQIALLPFKYSDANGGGTLFDATCALYMALENGAKVINTSWGYWGDECPALQNALHHAQNAEVLVVCAAGNTGDDNVQIWHWPSAYSLPEFHIDNIISVAALDANNPELLASYSNYSNAVVHLATEGTVVTTAIDTAGNVNETVVIDGTSFAAPKVARAVALLRYLYPDATPCDIKEALRMTVDTLQSQSADDLVWRGRLNFEKMHTMLESEPVFAACISSAQQPAATQGQDQVLQVYPNPFGETVQLQWAVGSSDGQPTRIRVYTGDGRLVYQDQSSDSRYSIATQDWKPGFYILQVSKAGKLYTEKLLKY